MDTITEITFKELNKKYEGTVWLNIKHKTRYIILGIGCNANNGEEGIAVVIYKLAGVKHPPFTRNLVEFLDKFKKAL